MYLSFIAISGLGAFSFYKLSTKLQNNKKILEIDKVKLKNVIDSTSFEKMKDLEKETGFRESKINPNTGKKIPFFNLGKKNDWKKMIDPKIKKN